MGNEDYPDQVEHLYCLFRAALIVAPGGYACNSSGMRWGVEMVGYECDADGRVKSWGQRIELSAPNIKAVRAKLFFLWENDMLHPVPVEVPFEFEDAQITRQS